MLTFGFITRLQHCVGIMNAYFMIDGLYDGKAVSPAICALCVLFTASWRLPQDRGEK